MVEWGVGGARDGAAGVVVGTDSTGAGELVKECQQGAVAVLGSAPPLERPFSFVHQKHKFRQRAMDELLEFARNYCETHQEAAE